MKHRQVFPNVPPIRPGYDWTAEISFAENFWNINDIGTGRIVAQFRKAKSSATVLFEADTDDNTIERPGSRTIRFSIVAANTALFTESIAVFDFIRIDGSDRAAIPGRWEWPVIGTVTRDVD